MTETKYHLENMCFYGVKWDKSAVDAVTILANALLEDAKASGERAKAIQDLTDIFKASNVTIESMLNIKDNESPTVIGGKDE